MAKSNVFPFLRFFNASSMYLDKSFVLMTVGGMCIALASYLLMGTIMTSFACPFVLFLELGYFCLLFYSAFGSVGRARPPSDKGRDSVHLSFSFLPIPTWLLSHFPRLCPSPIYAKKTGSGIHIAFFKVSPPLGKREENRFAEHGMLFFVFSFPIPCFSVPVKQLSP